MLPPDTDLGPDGLPRLPEHVENRLYEILLETPQTDRPALLEGLLTEHPDCRESVMLRVEAMTAGDDVLGRARTPLAEAPLPERIGGYRIRELLGEGGFGTVYRAEQSEPVHRVVALKVLHPRRIDERSQWRFQAERQTLARMQHRNIAQIYDAGSTPDGLLYFAMEFVDGEPITRWCDRHELGIDARLELFLQVCAAVHHAHQRSVVHRDIKPSNVLVMTEDGRPIPKVIDFGVAKVLEIEDGSSLATRDGALIGTPGYMSPEQAAGDPVDTRTDVYALGVLLYELLAGDLPFPRRLLAGSITEIAKLVREGDHRRLATALREAGDGAERIAAARGRSLPALLRDLGGDLEWVVRRALSRHPDQRYSSVPGLIADVERYRRLEPVTAREPEALYLARRFVVRHRLGVAVSLGVAAALVVVIAFLAWSLEQVDAARETAEDRTAIAVRNEYAAHLAAARAAILSGNATSARHHLDAAVERHRGWEWRYLSSLCDTSRATIPGDGESRVTDVVWLGGDRLCQFYADGRIVECDAAEAEPGHAVARLPNNYQRCIADRARARLFVIADDYSCVVELDTRSWQQRTLFRCRPALRTGRRDTDADIRSLALSPDQRTLAISQNTGAVTLLDTFGGTPPRLLCVAEAEAWAWAMEFTPDRASLVLAGGTGWLEVRDADSGLLTGNYFVAREGIGALALDASGTAVFAAGGEKLEKIDLATGRLLQRVDAGFRINRLIRRDGGLLYGTGRPRAGQFAAWSPHTLELAGRFHGHRSQIHGLDLHPDGSRVATSTDRSVRIWTPSPPPPVVKLHAGFNTHDLAVSPDGESFGTANTNGLVRVWGARDCALEFEERYGAQLYGCTLTERTIYAGGDRLLAIDRASGSVRELDVPGPVIGRMCTDPQARWLAAGSLPWGQLRIWRLPELELLHDLELPVTDRIVFDARRDRFLVCGTDDRLRWIDPGSGEVTAERHPDIGVWALANQDELIATGADRLFLREPGARDFRALGTARDVASIAIAPDLQRIATGTSDSTVAVWDRHGTELLVLDDAPMTITEMAFVLGGQRLVGMSQLSGDECYVMVWGAGLP